MGFGGSCWVDKKQVQNCYDYLGNLDEPRQGEPTRTSRDHQGPTGDYAGEIMRTLGFYLIS